MSPSRMSSAVLFFIEDRVLLRLRDDRPDLRYPNQWDLIGGAVEDRETIHEAAVREVKEEIERDAVGLEYFNQYPVEIINHVFVAPLPAPVEALVLNEGQRLALVTQAEAAALPLVPWVRHLLEDYFAPRR